MGSDSLDTLLSRLNAGDADAIEEVIAKYEPYLRMVVRRQLSSPLRAKFDSIDIVQSIWADILDGLRTARWNFQNTDQLRAFLVKVARNRLIDRLRQNRHALGDEAFGPRVEVEDLPATRLNRVSEVVQADDLWSQMLEVCPPAHYEMLHLKRKGASLAEIAAHTGLHESSVRRILYQIAKDVAQLRGGPQSELHSAHD